MLNREESIEVLRQEIAEMEANGCYSYKERKQLEDKKSLLNALELNLFEQIDKNISVPKVNRDDLLLPEYREGGYFTSQDFYDKCEEFHKMLEEQGQDFKSLRRDEYIFLKKKFLQDKYGITWLAEEYQYLPGVVKDVHISHPKN